MRRTDYFWNFLSNLLQVEAVHWMIGFIDATKLSSFPLVSRSFCVWSGVTGLFTPYLIAYSWLKLFFLPDEI